MNWNRDLVSIWNFWTVTFLVSPLWGVSSLYHPEGRRTALPRWMEPCRGSLDSDPEVLIPSLLQTRHQTDQLVAHRLWLKANEVRMLTVELRDRMADERIQSNDLQLYLEENTTLPGFPDHRMLTGVTRFADRLREDFRRVSTTAIFVEQIRTDEDQSTYSPSYTMKLKHIESQIYSLLCQLKMAVLNKGMRLPYVTNDVMSNSFRNVETNAERHMRDYRVVKDLVLLFYAVQCDYDAIRNGNQVGLDNLLVDADKR